MKRILRSVVLACALATPVGAVAATKTGPPPPKGALPYQAAPRPNDGANLALTIEKLEKGFDPERPFLIWAIGSSFTNGLGDGSTLIALLRERFPNLPKIVYKRMAGNSTPYHLCRGWARHLVIPEQPDLVLLYNFGKTHDLEELVAELRRHTTADIIMPTLHWCRPHQKVWPDPDARNSHQEPQALRAACEKHGVEFVENRRELTQYMLAHKLPIESLLGDSVHQTRYAAKMTNMNIARHVHRPAKFAYDPRSRERRLEAEGHEAVKAQGSWTRSGGALRADAKGSSITVAFTGSRIDLIGWRAPDGGTAEVILDGKPAAEARVFYAGYIRPNRKNAPAPPNPPRDRAPHRVTLGTHIVSQTWTLTMITDTADYQLVGSVTGPDGKGNARRPFTSMSGQIIVEPEFWRQPHTNRTGDTFTFEVTRCTIGHVDFKGKAEKFRLTLAQNLTNGPHTLKLSAQGDGPIAVDAFDVFEPPEK